MRNFVDLHTHSAASDGEMPPGEVVRLAERKRLAAVALTDHDTVDGLAEARRAADALAIRFIAGVEISAQFVGGMMHIVGLGIDPASRPLAAVMRKLILSRRQRNPKMFAKLRQLGVEVTPAEVRAAAGASRIVGRLHMAKVLCRKGYAKNIGDAFRRYIGYGAPAFVDKERLTPTQAIEAIHAAGGLAILAHPPHLCCASTARLEQVVRELAAAGLDGLEVYHSDHTAAQTRYHLKLVRRMKLLVSGGSDYHGPDKPDSRLGLPRVPLAAVEQLLAKLDG